MTSPRRIEYRTRMFARVLGPYLVVAAGTLVTRPAYINTLLRAFDTNSAWPWVTGAFVLPMGLVVVALHPYWQGTAAATVSTLGWLTVLKGVALMTFPQTYLSMGQGAMTTAWWETSVIIMALLGLYLSVVGWAPNHQPAEPTTAAADAVRELPRWV